MKQKIMLFKISLNGETHVMKFEKGQSFEDLRNYIENSFKKIPRRFGLVYIDEDEDEVSLDNDFDLESLLTREVHKVLIRIVCLGDEEREGEIFEGKNGYELIKE